MKCVFLESELARAAMHIAQESLSLDYSKHAYMGWLVLQRVLYRRSILHATERSGVKESECVESGATKRFSGRATEAVLLSHRA